MHWIQGENMSKVIDLLQKGLLTAGQEIIWNRRVAKQIHIATVNQDGSITTADGVKHKTPSGAAKHLNGNKPVDGWLAWKAKSSLVSLAELRAK
jgi:Restriction Enzyme Adenine Methylase Associated